MSSVPTVPQPPKHGQRVSPARRLFRELCAILADDPYVRGKVDLRCWAGRPGDGDELAPKPGRPAVRLTPGVGPLGWFGPNLRQGHLEVTVELAIDGADADAYLDLVYALTSAFAPPDDPARADAVAARLRAAGALAPEVEWGFPPDLPAAARCKGGALTFVGMFRVPTTF